MRKLIQDPNLINHMNHLEADAWQDFVEDVHTFLANKRAANFEEIVQNMLDAYQRLGENISIKVHFLHNHRDRIPANCSDVSD